MRKSVQTKERDLDGLQRNALIVGAMGLLALALGAILGLEQFFRSYLIGFLFWIGFGLGGLGLAALHQLTGGAWGMVLRRWFEAAARTLPFMALAFLPLAFGLTHIYEWTHPEYVQGDPLMEHKAPWLNIPFFLGRTAFYFIVWGVIATLISRGSAELDATEDPRAERRLRQFSAIALLLTVLTVTFAAFDWIMSLDPHWFSSIFGAIVGVGMILAAFALSVIGLSLLAGREPLRDVLAPYIYNDFGSLLLAFTMIWAYLSLSQFLIIWMGNLPEEVTWYLDRTEGGWGLITAALPIFHFALPFVLLLSRGIRSNPRRLPWIAGFLLLMHMIELLWLVKPSLHLGLIHWMDIAALVGIGGLWVALLLWQLKKRPLVPLLAVAPLRERAHAAH